MSYQLRRLSIGGILDQALAVVRDNLRLFFTILLYAWLPFQLLCTGINFVLTPEVDPNPTPEEAMQAVESARRYLPLAVGLTLIYNFAIVPLTSAAVMYAVAERYLGRDVTAEQAIRKGLGRIGALIWTKILMALVVVGGLLLFVVPGILLALQFGLSQNVVVLEGLSGGEALSRSKELVRPYMGTFLIMGAVGVIVTFTLGLGSTFIQHVHLKSAVVIVIQGVATVAWAAATVIFYFSCRCGLENFDLVHLATGVDERLPSQVELTPKQQ